MTPETRRPVEDWREWLEPRDQEPEDGSDSAEEPTQDALDSADEFDLFGFFLDEGDESSDGESEELGSASNQVASATASNDLLAELQSEASESIRRFELRVNADTFSRGVEATGSVFASLVSVAGACGPLCFHSLGSLAAAPGSSAVSNLGGLGLPGLSQGSDGSLSLSASANELAAWTGLSAKDIAAGKHSAAEVISRLLESFGSEMAMVFGFGLVEGIIDAIFGGQGSSVGEQAAA